MTAQSVYVNGYVRTPHSGCYASLPSHSYRLSVSLARGKDSELAELRLQWYFQHNTGMGFAKSHLYYRCDSLFCAEYRATCGCLLSAEEKKLKAAWVANISLTELMII
jgi:hypothetical protein